MTLTEAIERLRALAEHEAHRAAGGDVWSSRHDYHEGAQDAYKAALTLIESTPEAARMATKEDSR